MSVDTTKGHPDMDYAEHQKTYAIFLRATMTAIICIAALLAGMAYFLV